MRMASPALCALLRYVRLSSDCTLCANPRPFQTASQENWKESPRSSVPSKSKATTLWRQRLRAIGDVHPGGG
jgi:hypothetical protein